MAEGKHAQAEMVDPMELNVRFMTDDGEFTGEVLSYDISKGVEARPEPIKGLRGSRVRSIAGSGERIVVVTDDPANGGVQVIGKQTAEEAEAIGSIPAPCRMVAVGAEHYIVSLICSCFTY